MKNDLVERLRELAVYMDHFNDPRSAFIREAIEALTLPTPTREEVARAIWNAPDPGCYSVADAILQLLRKEGADYPATESEKPNA